MAKAPGGQSQRRRAGRPPRNEPPAVTREAIVIAARRTIAERGYDAMSVRGLARELGVSLSAIQHHFPRKDDLWAAVVQTAVQAMPRPDEPVGPVPNAAVRLRSDIRGRILMLFETDRMETALLTDSSEGAQTRLEELGEAISESLEQLRAVFGMAKSRGLIRDIDMDAWFALLGVGLPAVAASPVGVKALLGFDLETEEQQEQFADGVVDLLLNGVLPR